MSFSLVTGFELTSGWSIRTLSNISSSVLPKRSGEGLDFSEEGVGEGRMGEESEGLMSGLVSTGEGGEVGRGVGAGEMCMCEIGDEASD